MNQGNRYHTDSRLQHLYPGNFLCVGFFGWVRPISLSYCVCFKSREFNIKSDWIEIPNRTIKYDILLCVNAIYRYFKPEWDAISLFIFRTGGIDGGYSKSGCEDIPFLKSISIVEAILFGNCLEYYGK